MASSNALNTRPEGKSNTYAYIPEEKNLLANLMKKQPNLEDGHMVFNKHEILISEKDGIVYREYKTIKMVKEKYPFSGSYEYNPMYLNGQKVKVQDIRVNNIRSRDYKYEEIEDNFKILIPYTVQQADDPLFTFEVVFSYRDFLADCYANINLAYETENSCFSYNFTCQGFHFSGQNLEVPEKYKYVKTPTKVTCYGDIYEGDSLMEYLSCAFTKDVGVKLDKLGKISDNFYFLDKSEYKMIEESINSMEKDISYNSLNVVFSRDIYKFVKNKAYVKTYQVFFYPKGPNETVDNQVADFDINEKADLQITSFKISNKPAESNHKIDHAMCFFKPQLSFGAGEYFRTIEFDYTFTLKYTENGYDHIDITKYPSFVGGKYELYIKKDEGRDIRFSRGIETTSSNEYDIIYKSVFKTFDDDIYYFNVIKVHAC